MWGVLDPPEVRRQRSGSFYRRWTWRRQVIASGTRLLVALFVALLLWSGWYLANRGFGREFRLRVVEELRKRGIDASVRKLTLDPFRGIVARDLRIYDARHRETPLLAISEVALDINYAALLHRQPFLNAIDVRSADLTFPAPDGNPRAAKAQLKDFRAHIYFPPEQIYISQAEGTFCGIRISLTGQLLRRADSRSGGMTEAELRARMELVQRIAAELGPLRFAGGPPTLQVKFSGDLAEMEKAHIEATLSGEQIQRGSYEIKTLQAAAEWNDNQLNLTQCEWTDAQGAISARGSWERLTSRGEYQLRSSIALAPLLESFDLGRYLAGVSAVSPPQLELSGSFETGSQPPRLSAIGRLAVESFVYKGVPFTNLSAALAWDGARTMLRDLRVRHASGEASVDLLDAPGDFRLEIESSINPVALRTLIEGDLGKFLSQWEVPRSPNARMSIRGSSHDPETWTGDGTISLQRARFRGVWANHATASMHLRTKAITFDDLHVTRDEGAATGSFTYDWGHHEVRIDNVRTHLRPTEVIYWIEPKFFKIIAPYKFRGTPSVVANGVVQYRGGERTHLTIDIDAPGGMDYVFLDKTLVFDRVKGNLLVTDDRVQLTTVEGSLLGGAIKGNADIHTKDGDQHYSATLALEGVNFPKLTDLYFDFHTSRGLLAGNYTWQARGDDTRTMVGNGEMKVSNGDVFAIPVLGPLSTFIASVFPGAGFSIAKQATASFSIRDGVIHTPDLRVSGKAYDMLGHGDIDFLNDRMNLDVRISARGAGVVLTPLYNLFEYKGEGSLSKPNWHPKNF